MNRTILRMLAVVLCIALAGAFSIVGCQAEETTEEAAQGVEEGAEEVEQKVEDISEESMSEELKSIRVAVMPYILDASIYYAKEQGWDKEVSN